MIMKLRNLFVGAVAAVFALAGCQEKEQNLGTPDISISTNELTFDVEGGEQALTVNATRDWKVETDADWVVVDPAKGEASADDQTVTVTVLENTGMDRSADLKFTIGMKSKYLTVSQAGPGGSPEALIVYYNDYDKVEAEATYGSGSSWPYLDQFDGWMNQTGTGAANVEYAYSGMSARANSTSDSNYSDYAGSGKNNMFFGKSAYLATKNIALGGATDFTLTFGTEKYSKDNGSVFTKSEYHIFVSNDAAKWVEITDYTFAGDGTEGRWNLATANFSVPAGTENLSICIKVDVASSYRMDDFKLVISEGGAEVDFSKGVDMDFTAGGSTGGGSTTAPESKGKKTVEEFIAAADTQNYYELTGTVSGFNPTYCSFDLTDATGKIFVYSVLDASKAEWTSKISNGGTITIYGKYLYYEQKSQHEVVDAHIVNFTAGTVERPTDITDVTVEEFLKKEVDDTWYRLSGTVSGTLNTTYGNFDLTDETGSVYVYGIDNWSSYSAKFALGDKVTIVGHRYIYTNPNDGSVKDEVMDAYIESWTAGEGNTGSGGGNGGELDPDAAWSYLFANGDLGDSYSAPVTKTLNGAEWSFAMTGSTYLGWDSNNGRGLQMGKSKEPASEVTLSTSGISGNIKKIVVNTAGASGTDAELVVKVGETALGSPVKTTTTATDYTFEAETAVSGAVELKWTLTTAAVYIKSISVYTE